MARKNSAIYLGPDGYSRFFVIINILENLYKRSNRTLQVLDVGGGSPFLGELLGKSKLKAELTILDILPRPPRVNANYIQADATTADLPDGSFDVVISTDTLEHIPAKSKEAFIKACVRLAKDVCILAAPFDTPAVHEAEVMVNDFNKKLFGVGQDWLEEHFAFGKPDIKATKKLLNFLKLPYSDFGTNNLYSWLFSSHINLIEAKLGVNSNQSTAIKERYNLALGQSPEFTGPTYRHFFVIYKKESLASKQIPGGLANKAKPETLLRYMHDMLGAVATRMSALKKEAAKTAALAHERGLEAQRLSADLAKAGERIAALEAELQNSPARIIKSVKRRLTGKS